ncbi:OmpA family protein [Micromonospora eburnea]|uniref:Outer membrane protein OmpA n=1 Tax=Micromonospora eburnea TaxID=227316 RepID=A0A1C6TZL5_9ACTN|nr:OmpA family protein [Micromonospora eburnea]SCL47214.1 Outer membrane protein OmpA [Micromonospora eburnea]
MSRSAERVAALTATALVLGVLLVAPAATAGTASPAPGPIVVPGPSVAAGTEVLRPALDITAPALDILVPVEDLTDRSITAESPSRVELTLAADVLFAFGKAELTPAARGRLAGIAEQLRAEARGDVRIEGHTDSVGDEQSNLALSRRRAEAVRTELARLLGTAPVSFQVQGFGEARPVAPNQVDGRDNPEGRARNRRVEIRFDR